MSTVNDENVATQEDMSALAQRVCRAVIPPRFQEGFRGWKRLTPEHSALGALASDWAFSWQPGMTGLRLVGTIGCGKTLLACAILKRLIRRGYYNVQFVNTAELFMRIRATWNNRSEETDQEIIDELCNRDVLVLDDLGAETLGEGTLHEMVCERLYLLLDRISRKTRPTLIVTSNLLLPSLSETFGAGNGERIVSRLQALTEDLGRFPDMDVRRERIGQ